MIINCVYPKLYSADIEREKQKAKEFRAALDEQIQLKKDLVAKKKVQEAEYMKEQEVRCLI